MGEPPPCVKTVMALSEDFLAIGEERTESKCSFGVSGRGHKSRFGKVELSCDQLLLSVGEG